MTGWHLRLWRRSMLWSRERAAAELGVSLRTYKSYENAEEIKRAVALATVTLSLTGMMPAFRSQQLSAERLLQLLGEMTESVSKEV
ncbi:hypothetical protein PRCB_09000 [Pantoea rodasii]|uniref:XRE family transcriptional regulator n=1 Tax=Pantoea rodasii TaxID=1076549 RepID=A0A2M9WE95_9GAMM|nr:hypothetical protein [Pantoea rodasii]ORM59717.1 hypothetical protein HA45_22435 [Pantoea rodasii]PJZ05856.1 hypothetical protein PRCB_09000 [Pantoea rodasii]